MFDRKAIIKSGNTIVSKKLTRGCPQGSALGPGLWNINYDELLTLSTESKVAIKGCCDDTKILIHGSDLKTIERKANKVLKDVYDWGQRVKLEFNATKTTALLITKKKDKNLNIKMNGIAIELKDSVKYLGVILDEKLNYNKHIQYIKNKTTEKLSKMPLMTRNTWGLRYDALKTIYKAAFEPSILYCCSVWAKSLTQQNIKKLKSIQRLFAIKIIRAYRTISYESAITIAGLTPIDLRIKENNLLNLIKHEKTGQVLGLMCDHMERKVDVRLRPHPSLAPRIVFIEGQHRPTDYDFEIFTDGSKTYTSVGASYVAFSHGLEQSYGKYRVGTLCSVFQTELIAIQKAIQWLKAFFQINTQNEKKRKVLILADSQSAVKAIKQFQNPHPLVFDIKSLVKSSEDLFEVHIKWIKGHSGIEGNEKADELAKMAADMDAKESVYNSFPLSFAKRHFKSVISKEWEQCWQSTTKASQTKQFFPEIKDRNQLDSLKPNYITTQYLSGHGNFRSYLKRFGHSETDLCDCGDNIQTPSHLIYDCILYSEERHQLNNAMHRSGHSLVPPKLLKEETLFKEFLIFIKNINNCNY